LRDRHHFLRFSKNKLFNQLGLRALSMEMSNLVDFALSQDTPILRVAGAGVNGDEQPGTDENFEAVHWHDAAAVQDEEAEDFTPASPANCLKIDSMLNHDPAPPATTEAVNDKIQIDDVLLPIESESKVSEIQNVPAFHAKTLNCVSLQQQRETQEEPADPEEGAHDADMEILIESQASGPLEPSPSGHLELTHKSFAPGFTVGSLLLSLDVT
jgi:hypothetical protein